MTIGEEIRELNRAEPFRSYGIHSADGQTFIIKDPNYCFVSPGNYVLYAFETEKKRHTVAVAKIASVEQRPMPE